MQEPEKEKWKDVEPCMMSDEESLEDSAAIERRRPEWRSAEFNELIDILDQRADEQLKNARKQRILCSPWKIGPPKECKTWMTV